MSDDNTFYVKDKEDIDIEMINTKKTYTYYTSMDDYIHIYIYTYVYTYTYTTYISIKWMKCISINNKLIVKENKLNKKLYKINITLIFVVETNILINIRNTKLRK